MQRQALSWSHHRAHACTDRATRHGIHRGARGQPAATSTRRHPARPPRPRTRCRTASSSAASPASP
eukprot:6241135-Prymnesium_polylepis.1